MFLPSRGRKFQNRIIGSTFAPLRSRPSYPHLGEPTWDEMLGFLIWGQRCKIWTKKNFSFENVMRMKEQRLEAIHALKSYWCRPISALDFTNALANHKPELKLGKSVTQSARIQMMIHYMSQPCKTIPCSSDFHDTRVCHPIMSHNLCSIYILLTIFLCVINLINVL